MNIQSLYDERHRLALEELVSGGRDSYLRFLQKEGIPSFLSDDEILCIAQSAVLPECSDDSSMEQSLGSSTNCSSATYFPDVSDLEPPELEVGWHSLGSGASRGVTRAVARFQPSCKEAARRMIKSAKEVIAIVTDSLTDLDILCDLKEASARRRVPVYILLDQSGVLSFLQMCTNVNVRLDSLQHMCVRTITGATYFMRSGAKIVGKANERFMLIDGNRVATGSYRFSWMDGKLNSNNLMELSGQITENFDEEFRILYAQSLPLSAQLLATNQPSSTCDNWSVRAPLNQEAHWVHLPEPMGACKQGQPGVKDGETNCEGYLPADTSTIVVGEQDHASVIPSGWKAVEPVDSKTQLHIRSPTGIALMDSTTQTDPQGSPACQGLSTSATQTEFQGPASSRAESESWTGSISGVKICPRPGCSPDGAPSLSFCKLAEERQHRYSRIRSKLDRVVSLLSSRCQLVELAARTFSPQRRMVRDRQENIAVHTPQMWETHRPPWTKYQGFK